MPRQARHHPPGVPRWDGESARRARTGPQRHRSRGYEVHPRRLEQLQTEGHEIRDEDIARLSPLKHRNLNPLGRYSFTASVPAGERELTYDGLNVAEAKGNKGGRAAPPSRPRRPRPCAPGTWKAVPSPPSPATTASAASRSAPPSPLYDLMR
ncbi:hypothetical protein GCM10010221_54400 [Streptomyces parvus]|nr:hypothetical protein GCM10010221_54400 [Streptomyces parvus]